jgi:hypothetical protein
VSQNKVINRNWILIVAVLAWLLSVPAEVVSASETSNPRQTYEESYPDHGLGPDLKSQKLIEEKIEGNVARCRYEAIMKNGEILYPFALLRKGPENKWIMVGGGCSKKNYNSQLCLTKSQWLLEADSIPFSRKALAGKMMGQDFKNANCKIVHIGNSIEIEFSDNHKPNPTIVLLSLKQDEKSAMDLKCSASSYQSKTLSWISVNGRTFSIGDFGLHLSLGQKNNTGYKPIFIVLRFNDELKSHLEGCCYATDK